MSLQIARAFMNKVNQDSSLQAKLRLLAADDLNGLLKTAADAGFAFGAEDLVAAQTLSSTPASDLSENDLDMIAGGGGNPSQPIQLQRLGIGVTGTCAMTIGTSGTSVIRPGEKF